MAKILPEHREKVLVEIANVLYQGRTNSLVSFEIKRRKDDVPGNLMELFLLPKDSAHIENWHKLNPSERFGWVGTLLRYRIPGTLIQQDVEQGKITLHYLTTKIFVDFPLPHQLIYQNYWKRMDEQCLLFGVAFSVAVTSLGGAALFDDKETIREFLDT